MSRSFTLQQLTEGIRERHVGAESNKLMEKWARTGLLRGLSDHGRETMSRLLENQAAQVLREANVLGSGGSDSGQVDGFSNIAFPIVRRVFGGLVANELVSIQPMSLPSGLLFYLDYTYGSDVGGDSAVSGTSLVDTTASTYSKGQSLYNNPVGKAIRTGSDAVGGQYDLVGTDYTRRHVTAHKLNTSGDVLAYGAFGGDSTQSYVANATAAMSGADGKLLQFDPQIVQLLEEGGDFSFLVVATDHLTGSGTTIDPTAVKSLALYHGAGGGLLVAPPSSVQSGTGILNVRRLNQLGTWDSGTSKFTPNPLADVTQATSAILCVVSGAGVASTLAAANSTLSASFGIADGVTTSIDGGAGATLVIPSFESNFASVPEPVIPEIDIKIESIAVTATTRKLRARWSPELAQDLNAYHSMDAEVELTQILSEQIALEIDREILNDLLTEARGANFFWSRSPGKFVNKRTGAAVQLASSLSTGPQFTGTVREWYETLVETIIDVANEIHRKTLRGSANFLVCSPEVATIFEASVLYKPSIKIDGQGQVGGEFTLGAAPIGSLSNRFTVYKDPYFPRNKILVGYKGGSYLETGYVYAPYVPLIVTPTIFAPEDFTPRKGVMTRYGKKMVRADFYGTVTCLDMDII
jgi:hypothetical protein